MTIVSGTSSSQGTGSGSAVSAQERAQLEVRADLVTVTVDGVEVQVPKGTLVIRAAELIGVAIPRFCDHPLLDPVGACRQCLVDIPDAGNGRAMPKPQASCTIEVADGMKISTQLSSPVADKAQKGVMELLLINHPLDCPICDKGGECPLQNQALSNGRAESRFDGVKRTFPKPINISAQVLLDRERCVLCARCTRFSEQIAGDPFIALVERGALQQVGIYEREPFESYFSGNTIQICPVGALTSAAYRFRSRPFDLVSTPSIAEHDAAGAAIRIDHRRGEVLRRQSGDDPDVNEEWISDKDRFAFRSNRSDDRVTRPLVRDDDGSFRPASWPEALDVAARGLQAAGSDVGVLTGGRLTVEDAYGYAKFARAVLGTNDIDFRARPQSAEETAFLGHVVAGTGVSHGTSGYVGDRVGTVSALGAVTFAGLESASTVLLVALEPEEECPTLFLRLRKAHRKSGLPIWTVASYRSNGARKMSAGLVPSAPGAEAATLADLAPDVALDSESVILVGERAAGSPGTLTAVVELARRTGARLAWVPRRAGDRGALEAGCLPTLLPGGRPVADGAGRVDTQTTWGVGSLPAAPGRTATEILAAPPQALIVAGVEVDDFADPAAALTGVEDAGFVISLERRFSAISERADVVFPVCVGEERAGSFWNWEGRERSFGVVLNRDNAMSDLRVLAALADALDRPLGLRTPAAARAELAELGSWDGERVAAPEVAAAAVPAAGSVVLATWRTLLDDSRAVDNEPHLQSTGRAPVARLNPRTAAAADVEEFVRITAGTGPSATAVTLPVELVEDMVLGVVWIPDRVRGLPTLGAAAGTVVTIGPGGKTTHAGGAQ